MLTPQQVNHFHTFGYLKMPGLFHDEFPRIETSFHEVWGMQGEVTQGRRTTGCAGPPSFPSSTSTSTSAP